LSQVRTHTRQQGGKTVTVRRHERDPEAAAATAQRKRDTFERRVLRERQQAANPSAYTKTTTRTAGERRRKRGPQPARAKRRAKKALRLWRRHKVRAVFHFAVAGGELGAWAAWRGAANTRNSIRKIRQRRKDSR
jgi:hypothetical protein